MLDKVSPSATADPEELSYATASPTRTITNEGESVGDTKELEKDVITTAPTSSAAAATPSEKPSDVQQQQQQLGKDGKPEHWLERTELVLPKNNLYVVFTGLMLTVFLSALDQTIVSTALPTIAADLKSSPSGYSWVGSAYLLASTAVIPLYGRASDLVGRKPMLWLAMVLFLFGSAMCGAAQSTTWLSVCRGVQGLGGGGTISLANILIGDLVPLSKRGNYAGLYGEFGGSIRHRKSH